MALFIPADGNQETKEVQPANGKSFTRQELQGYVGGYIENVEMATGGCMIVNEDGKFANPCVRNERATALIPFKTAGEIRAEMAEAKARGGFAIFVSPIDLPDDDNAPSDFIAGNVIVCSNEEAG